MSTTAQAGLAILLALLGIFWKVRARPWSSAAVPPLCLLGILWIVFASPFLAEYAKCIGLTCPVARVLVRYPLWASVLIVGIVTGLVVWQQHRAARNMPQRREIPSSGLMVKSITAAVDIRLASPANQASEPTVEWIHLECQGRAPDARIWASIGGNRYDLRWQTPKGPVQQVTLRSSSTHKVPFLLRGANSGMLYGIHVSAGLCYATDEAFFTRSSLAQIAPGEHDVKVTVEYGQEGASVTRTFKLIVPSADRGSINLRRVLESG